MTLHAEQLTAIEDLPHTVLRKLDSLECFAGGLTNEQAIRLSVDNSTEAFAVYRDGELFAVWGFRGPSSVGGGPARMWLLTTPEVDKYKVAFVREGKRLLTLMLTIFGAVDCVVWQDHVGAKRFLKALGFAEYTLPNTYRMPEFICMVKEAA